MATIDRSILFKPAVIAILANTQAIPDLEVFFTSLQLWNSELPPVYMYCCSKTLEYLDKKKLYRGPLTCRVMLDSYSSYTRSQMERLPSVEGLSNLFHDFTQEKCGLVEWAYKHIPDDKKEQGVLFCDADICWLGPLPSIPKGKVLGVSPHMIRKEDEALYGEYNAGFLWTNQSTFPKVWKQACKTSRFFEQAALEVLADNTPDEELYIFGETINYGWWRMYQSSNSIQVQQGAWSLNESNNSREEPTGLYIHGIPVCCIHTHWITKDTITHRFNSWIFEKLRCLINIHPAFHSLMFTLNMIHKNTV